MFDLKQKISPWLWIPIGLLFVFGVAFRTVPAMREVYRHVQLYYAVLERIHEDYVDETDTGDLTEHAIHGLLEELDPHTTFMNAEEFLRWNQDFEGYSGIGIFFDIIKNKITIMSVISGGPSEAIGLKAGDRIVAINGFSAIGMKRDEVPLKLKGPQGTSVTVSIQRRGWEQPRDFTILRDAVHVKSVPYAFMLMNGTAYIYISRFSANTAAEFNAALDSLEKQGMTQLLLDLRQNGGGYLDAAVDIVNQFLPGGKRIVYTDGRVRASFREFFSTENGTRRVPVIVLIDRTSASASEIVAGALQDWDRALIVGETSFGKGLVQSQYRFEDGSALLMTTARYHTPSGRVIQRPYSGKSLDDYYSEIWMDSLRTDQNHLNKPRYETLLLKRFVYGGGGIRPDFLFQTQNDTLAHAVRAITLSPKRLLFTFAEDYSARHPELQPHFTDFLKGKHPDTDDMKRFLIHIRNEGFVTTENDFSSNADQIRFLLRQQIAEKYWGPEARYKIQMLRDRQLLEALELFPESAKLFARAYPQN